MFDWKISWKISRAFMWYPTEHMALSKLYEMNGMGELEKYEVIEKYKFTPVLNSKEASLEP